MLVKKTLTITILIFVLYSCIPYRSIDIQYYDKPKQRLPINSGKILILANLYNRELPNKKAMLEWALDSVAAVEATNSLGELLISSPYYEELIPVNSIFFREDTSKVILPLSWSQLSEISQNNDSVNYIVSLDYMRINPYSDNYIRWVDGVRTYNGYLDIAVYCYWRVYDLKIKKISNSFLYRDTLSWEATDWIEVKTGNQLPGFFTASAYAGADAAEKYAKLIAPTWNNDTRILFNGNSKFFSQASAFAEKGNWIDAAALWQKHTADKKRSIAARAAFNMALANEMLGNFEVALEWLKEAQKLNPRLEEINYYRSVIEERIEANK